VKWIALFAGGGLGASLRYLLSAWVDQRMASPFPWGTLCVNFVGSLLLGLIAHQIQQRNFPSPTLQLFLIVGILGAFTTFSTFSLETFRLIESGRLSMAAASAVGSVVICLVAVAIGVDLSRSLG
jgi:CrcB protein